MSLTKFDLTSVREKLYRFSYSNSHATEIPFPKFALGDLAALCFLYYSTQPFKSNSLVFSARAPKLLSTLFFNEGRDCASITRELLEVHLSRSGLTLQPCQSRRGTSCTAPHVTSPPPLLQSVQSISVVALVREGLPVTVDAQITPAAGETQRQLSRGEKEPWWR